MRYETSNESTGPPMKRQPEWKERPRRETAQFFRQGLALKDAVQSMARSLEPYPIEFAPSKIDQLTEKGITSLEAFVRFNRSTLLRGAGSYVKTILFIEGLVEEHGLWVGMNAHHIEAILDGTAPFADE